MRLSVVIPTLNRRATLERTLAVLRDQTIAPGRAELIVVDNGSSDGTAEALAQLAATVGSPLPLRAVSEPQPGASRARNTGARLATGEILMFLGDDTAPAEPDLLERHLELHAERREPDYAVLGRVAWAPQLAVTPLMRWLERGPQFAFDVMEPGPAGPEHFYTAHVSLKRSLFERAGGFDETLPFLFEDAELGERLMAHGLVLDYRPELLVHHDHPITLRSWIARQENAGRAGRLVQSLRAIDERIVPRPGGWRFAGARAVAALAGCPDSEFRRLPAALRDRLYSAAHWSAYERGWRAADRP